MTTFTPFDPHAADLGIPSLDAEHRGQIELMNRLGASIVNACQSAEVADGVGDLVAYLDAHFMSEQVAMRERAFPDYEEHVAEHERAIELLRELQWRSVSGDTGASLEVLNALETWLIGHIREADAEYARFAGNP